MTENVRKPIAKTEQTNFILLCPTCKKEVSFSREDSIQKWYKCENGHETANPIKQELNEYLQFGKKFCKALEEWYKQLEPLALDPNLEEVWLEDLHRTVSKYDDAVSKVNFLTALSAYYIPLNTCIKGESGAGKTYGSQEVVSYFPDENIRIIGSQSPKVISHEYGKLMTGDDEPFNFNEAPIKPKRKHYDTNQEFEEELELWKINNKEWEEKVKKSYHLIELKDTTYLFLDTISYETFEMFKTVLSHDKPRITHKYVDERGRVHTTVLSHWPSTIFCTVDKKWFSEFSTRTLTTSPSIATDKLNEGKKVTNKKVCYPWNYEKETETKQRIKALIKEIREIFRKYNLKVVCPFPDSDELFSSTAARDMRDYNHFTEMVSAHTMLKTFQRPIAVINNQKYLVSSIEDIRAAKKLFEEIETTTKTGTEQRIIDFYTNIVSKYGEGATLDEIVTKYNEQNPSDIKSDYTIRWWLKRLNKIGWVQIKKKVQRDERKLTYYPLKNVQGNKQTKINETTVKNDSQTDLDRKLQKQFKKWLETISKEGVVSEYELFDFCTSNTVSIPVEEFVKKVVGTSIDNLLIVSEEEEKPKEEKKLETIGEEEITPDPLILEVFLDNTGRRCKNCGLYAVEVELHDTVGNTRNSYCVACGKIEKKTVS